MAATCASFCACSLPVETHQLPMRDEQNADAHHPERVLLDGRELCFELVHGWLLRYGTSGMAGTAAGAAGGAAGGGAGGSRTAAPAVGTGGSAAGVGRRSGRGPAGDIGGSGGPGRHRRGRAPTIGRRGRRRCGCFGGRLGSLFRLFSLLDPHQQRLFLPDKLNGEVVA